MTSTAGEKYVMLPKLLSNNDEWLFETQIADTGIMQSIALNYDDSRKWAGHTISSSQWFANSGINDVYVKPYQIGDKLTIIRKDGADKIILNNNIIISDRIVSHNDSFKVGFYTNNGRTQKAKNIKLKKL